MRIIIIIIMIMNNIVIIHVCSKIKVKSILWSDTCHGRGGHFVTSFNANGSVCILLMREICPCAQQVKSNLPNTPLSYNILFCFVHESYYTNNIIIGKSVRYLYKRIFLFACWYCRAEPLLFFYADS